VTPARLLDSSPTEGELLDALEERVPDLYRRHLPAAPTMPWDVVVATRRNTAARALTPGELRAWDARIRREQRAREEDLLRRIRAGVAP